MPLDNARLPSKASYLHARSLLNDKKLSSPLLNDGHVVFLQVNNFMSKWKQLNEYAFFLDKNASKIYPSIIERWNYRSYQG